MWEMSRYDQECLYFVGSEVYTNLRFYRFKNYLYLQVYKYIYILYTYYLSQPWDDFRFVNK